MFGEMQEKQVQEALDVVSQGWGERERWGMGSGRSQGLDGDEAKLAGIRWDFHPQGETWTLEISFLFL